MANLNPGAVSGVRVAGLAELNRALARTSKEVRVGIRKELREIAEPIRAEAQQLAVTEIRGIRLAQARRSNRRRRSTGTPKHWERMRTGLTLSENVIYVAPRERGVKTRGDDPRRRPNLADLLMGRSMEPALQHHVHQIEDRVGAAIDRIADRFSN